MRSQATTLPGRRFDFPVLIAGLAAAFCLWGLVEMMEVALSTTPHAFDPDILLSLRVPGHTETPIGPHWLFKVMRALTSLGSTAVLSAVTVLTIVNLLVRRQPRTALFVFLAVVGGQVVGALLKFGIERPRPEIVPHLMHETSYSFPSGHAMISAVTYLTIAILTTRLTDSRAVQACLLAAAVVLSILIGISRLYLGVHWPSDVFGGWCAGFAWALLCWLGARFLQRRRETEAL